MIDLTNQIAQSWWSWIGPMFLQVSLLILIIGGIDMLIRRWAWPQVRYALWLLVLIKLLIPPTWSLPSGIIPKIQPLVKPLHVFEVTTSSSQITTLPASQTGDMTTPAAVKPSLTKGTASSAKTAKAPLVWQAYAMGIWILGMVFFVTLLGLRIAKLRRWHKEQEEKQTIPDWFHQLLVRTAQQLKLERLPAIVFSDQAVTPAVYGVFRPVLLLPANYFDSLSAGEAEHVLLHELAHLKRGDLWLHGLCLMLQIVYWFNPLMIWVRKQMKHVREICCDLTVARRLKEKTGQYRQTLLNTARELLTQSVEPGMGLLGIFEEPFRLVARLKWLKKNTWMNRKQVVAAVFLVTFTMIACVLPMASAKAEIKEPTSPANAAPDKTGITLTYRVPENRDIQYHMSSETVERTIKNNKPEEGVTKNSVKYSVRAKGFKGKNRLLRIHLDALDMRIEHKMSGAFIPYTDSLVGKEFYMVLSPVGKELEFFGADSLKFEIVPGLKQDVAYLFRDNFPDLTNKPVKVGDSWDTQNDFTANFLGILQHVVVDAHHTLKGIETLEGLECIKVKTTFTGTNTGKGQVKGVYHEYQGKFKGTSTWYFAYKEGILVKAAASRVGEIYFSKGHDKKPTHMTSETKGEINLINW